MALWLGLGLVDLLVPLALEFTPHAFFGYRAAPSEVVRADRHDVVQTKWVCRADDCDNLPEIWRDKRTGKEFRRGDCRDHRFDEARRLGWTWFAYALLGCMGVVLATGHAAHGRIAHAALASIGIAGTVAILIHLAASS